MSGKDINSGEVMEEVVKDNEAALQRYACRILGDRESAKDIVQEAFVRLFGQISGGGGGGGELPANVKAWLYRTTRNLCYDLFRSARHRNEEVSGPETIGQIADCSLAPDAQLARLDELELVRRQINTLDARSREVLMLKLEHGRSYREIAEIMELTVTNVGFILHKAVKRIADSLGEAEKNQEVKRGAV